MALLPKDQKGQTMVLIGVVGFLLAFLYYNFLYKGRVADIEELETQVSELEMKNDRMRAQVARFGTDLPRRLELYSEHVRQLEQLIPRREDVPMLINQITQQAHDLGVELAALNPSAEEPGDYYSKQSYEVHVLGEYHRIGEYLAGLGSLPRIIRARDIKVSIERADPENRRPPLLRAGFRIETYIIPGDVPPADTVGNNAN